MLGSRGSRGVFKKFREWVVTSREDVEVQGE